MRFAHVATQAVSFAGGADSSVACEVIRRRAGGALDPSIAAAFLRHGPELLAAAGHRRPRPRGAWPAGLSDREVEVLRLIATGATYRGVAHHLVISPRTAAHHVQHIYNKIGVSSRAAAAMFAMEHDLVPR